MASPFPLPATPVEQGGWRGSGGGGKGISGTCLNCLHPQWNFSTFFLGNIFSLPPTPPRSFSPLPTQLHVLSKTNKQVNKQNQIKTTKTETTRMKKKLIKETWSLLCVGQLLLGTHKCTKSLFSFHFDYLELSIDSQRDPKKKKKSSLSLFPLSSSFSLLLLIIKMSARAV